MEKTEDPIKLVISIVTFVSLFPIRHEASERKPGLRDQPHRNPVSPSPFSDAFKSRNPVGCRWSSSAVHSNQGTVQELIYSTC